MKEPGNQSYFSKKVTLLNVVSTILVVYLHAKPQERFGIPLDSSSPFIYSVWVFTQIAVPLFFFLSGLLFYRNCTWDNLLVKLRSRVKTLLVPYLLWNIVFVGVFWVLTHVSFFHSRMHAGDVLNSPREVLVAILNARYTVLWFVKDLMIMCLFSPMVLLMMRRKLTAILLLVVSFLPFFFIEMGYEHVLRWFPIYYCGALSGRINGSVRDLGNMGRRIVICLAGLIFMVTYALSWYDPEGLVTPYRLLAPLCVWVSTDLIAHDYITSKFAVKKWMTYTFVIYCVHQFLLNVLEKVVTLHFSPSPLVLNLTYLLAPIAVLGISIGACACLSHTRIYKLFSGGR